MGLFTPKTGDKSHARNREFKGAPLYYTQTGSTLKLYLDADKTIEFINVDGLKLEFTISSNFIKIKFIAVGETDGGVLDYSLYFYEKV